MLGYEQDQKKTKKPPAYIDPSITQSENFHPKSCYTW